jgi:hypothetical protein
MSGWLMRAPRPGNEASTRPEAWRIIGMTVAAAAAYGIVMDQITARVCLEYFTVGHPPIFPTTSPTLLALGWGVLATWWVSLPLGVVLALCARLGSRPRVSAQELRGPIFVLLGVMGVCAVLSGALGAMLAQAGLVALTPYLAEHVPVGRHTAFLADLWAHSASYVAGMVGGLVLVVRTYRARQH